MQSEARNSSGDENVRAPKPNSFSKSGNESRTDSSSSTTDTSCTVIEFHAASTATSFRKRRTRLFDTGLVEEVDVSVKECCLNRRGTVKMRQVTRGGRYLVSTPQNEGALSGEQCLLHFSIGVDQRHEIGMASCKGEMP